MRMDIVGWDDVCRRQGEIAEQGSQSWIRFRMAENWGFRLSFCHFGIVLEHQVLDQFFNV